VEPAAAAALPDQAVEDERLRRLLLAVLDALDFEKRSIIVMHDVDGMPVPEIAKLLEVPLNTAYSRLRLARAAFEKKLESLGGAR
jgi:RNA polymerase sigma-70 factor (ECF subfamily)